MRKEFGRVMKELVQKDRRVYPITLDGAHNIFCNLVKENPQRYLNFGLSEAASVSAASGMALKGLKPYLFTILPFTLDRVFEQIKLDIVEQKADVKLVGYWNYPDDGPTHESPDVPGICKILGIRLFEARDISETRRILLETYEDNLPAFIYLNEGKLEPKAKLVK